MPKPRTRPSNGPGANGLRGGANVYSNKTAIGTWMESYGGPGGYQRGFSTVDFATEGQHQQVGVHGPKFAPKLFGAPLPPTINPLDYNPNEEKSKDWATVSRSSFNASWPEEWKPTMNMSKAELTSYRNKWCTDNEIGRKIRFETESQRAGNAAASQHLKTNRIRVIPGSPLAMEKLKKQLVDCHGILAISSIKFHLGNNNCTDMDLNLCCTKLGIKLTPLEYSQIMAFLTTSTVFDPNKLMELLSINAGELKFDSKPVEDIWKTMIAGGINTIETEDANYSISIEDLILHMKFMSEDKHPEIIFGLTNYLRAYGNGYELAFSDFVQLHQDFFVSSTPLYTETLDALWGYKTDYTENKI